MLLVGAGWHVWVSLVVVGLLFEMELMVVSLMVSVGLFRLDRRLVAVGWQLWVSLMVEGMLFVGVGWHAWVSLVVDDVLFELERMVSLMAGDGLFKLELGWVVVGWQLWLSLMVGSVLFVEVGWRMRGHCWLGC